MVEQSIKVCYSPLNSPLKSVIHTCYAVHCPFPTQRHVSQHKDRAVHHGTTWRGMPRVMIDSFLVDRLAVHFLVAPFAVRSPAQVNWKRPNGNTAKSMIKMRIGMEWKGREGNEKEKEKSKCNKRECHTIQWTMTAEPSTVFQVGNVHWSVESSLWVTLTDWSTGID